MADRAPLESAEVAARKLGRSIAKVVPPGWGFVIFLASYETEGYATFLSSMEREGMVKMVREILDKVERGDPDV